MSNHILVGYSDLTGYKPKEEELTQIIKSFNRDSTFHLLTLINSFISLFPTNFQKGENFVEIQRFLSRSLLEQDLWNLTNIKLQGSTPLERPIFNRWQMLYLMKRVLLESPTDGIIDPGKEENTEARYLFGRACLMANDFVTSKEQDEITKSSNPQSDSERERVLSELLAQMLPMGELMNPPEIADVVVRISKYLEISGNSFPNFKDGNSLSNYFETLTGINLETFIEMVLVIQTWFITQNLEDLKQNPGNFNLNRNIWFSNLTYSENEIDSFFKLTSSNISQIIPELQSLQNSLLLPQYDLRIFRKLPIFFLNEQSFTIIDYGLLTEKVLLGLYHTILNTLPDDVRIRNAFFQHWGKVFEIYINNIFREIYPELSQRFFPNSFFDHKEENEAFDGIIEYPNTLLVMEYKGGLLNSNAKYGGNKELLLNELDKKFGFQRKDAGLSQLARKIEILYNSDKSKRLGLRNLAFDNVNLIYPILVVNETSLDFGLANWQLRQWFEREIKLRQIDEKVSVKPLVLLSVDDLETLITYIDAGDFTLLEFVEFYADSLKEDWFEPMTTIGEVFSNFREYKKISFRFDEKTQNDFSNFVERIVSKFRTYE